MLRKLGFSDYMCVYKLGNEMSFKPSLRVQFILPSVHRITYGKMDPSNQQVTLCT
jgi:hypothetical protein